MKINATYQPNLKRNASTCVIFLMICTSPPSFLFQWRPQPSTRFVFCQKLFSGNNFKLFWWNTRIHKNLCHFSKYISEAVTKFVQHVKYPKCPYNKKFKKNYNCRKITWDPSGIGSRPKFILKLYRMKTAENLLFQLNTCCFRWSLNPINFVSCSFLPACQIWVVKRYLGRRCNTTIARTGY